MNDEIGDKLPLSGWVSWVKDPMFLLVGALVFSLDQITKALVRHNLTFHESVPRDGFFRLTHTTNTGSAFGLFPDQTLFLILASFVGIGILVMVYRSHGFSSPLLRLSLGLQMGGALGNLTDRLRMGEVTDFIDVGSWPIFNIADAAIVTGIILLAVMVFTRDRPGLVLDEAEVELEGGEPGSASHDNTPGPGYRLSMPGQNINGLRPALPCPVCNDEMHTVPGGWRCSGCGVKEHLEGKY